MSGIIHTLNKKHLISNHTSDISDVALVCDDEISFLDIPDRDEIASDKQLQYKCEECEVSYKHRDSLRKHTSSKHEGILYSCQYCEYNATRQSSLTIHIESVHEGVKYQCNQCGNYFTGKSNLR